MTEKDCYLTKEEEEIELEKWLSLGSWREKRKRGKRKNVNAK